MDFDDLEEALEDRVAAGELDEEEAKKLGLYEAEAMAEIAGTYPGGNMWPMLCNAKFPDNYALPERMREGLPPPKMGKAIRMRLLIFYGAGDSYPFWANFLHDLPDWVDGVVYEWPSHGSRPEEPLPAHVDGLVDDAMVGLQGIFGQQAKGCPMEGAPFAMIGHSIGALVMLGVAEKAKARFGIEPCGCFVFDRAAPHHRLTSDFGTNLLNTDAADFMRIFNPAPYNAYQSVKGTGNKQEEKIKRMLQMWMDDIKLQNCTKSEGWHIFKCPVHVFVAMKNWDLDSPASRTSASSDPLMMAFIKEKASIQNVTPPSAALWDFSMYEDWHSWTTTGKCTIHKIDTDHNEVRRHADVLRLIMQVLKENKAKDAPAD